MPDQEFFTFTDDRQRGIYRRLELVGDGPATYYRDVRRLLYVRDPFQTTTHLVGHLIREIESSIRDVLLVVADRKKISLSGSQTRLRTILVKTTLRVFPELKIESDREGHKNEIRQILKGLEIGQDNLVGRLWLKHAPSLAHGWAHRDNLNAPRPLDSEFLRYVDEMESVFDLILSKFESKYATIHGVIDAKLKIENPTRADAKWLKTSIPNNRAARGYFFDNLHNPKWLWPLSSERLFSRPPEAQFNPETKLTMFPTWPASRCLARMATIDDPTVKAKVAEILLSIETANFTIHLNILEAACKLPVNLAGCIADKETAWLQSGPFIDTLIPDKFADLLVHLANSGDSPRALAINRVSLGFLEEPGKSNNEIDHIFGEPRTRLDRWHFGQFVGKTWAALAKADWEASLTQYSDLLREYLDRRYPNTKDSGDSYSSSWLTGVEHDEDDIVFRLVATVRKTSELAISHDINLLPRVLGILGISNWDVLKRIILHVLRYCSNELDNEVLAQPLMVSDSFRDRNLFHEYSLLLADVFDRLSDDQRSTILYWIDSFVPTIETVQERVKRWHDVEISREDAEWEIRKGKLRWLECLKDKLPNEWRQKYEEWTEHFGGPLKALEGVQAMWVGEPPIPEFLRTRSSSPDELLFYLRGQPKQDESPYELARELGYLVGQNPDGFIDAEEKARELEPRYVRAILTGVHSGSRQMSNDRWTGLLSLMRWVIEQPASQVSLDAQDQDENAWVEARSVVGDIISSHLSGEEVHIPFDHRFEVWTIIEALANDPNPTPAYEARYGGDNMDPLTLSLNTIRGKAFHTIFKYLNWCRRTLNDNDRSLKSTSEVLTLLADHLKPEVDPSVTVRAIYGERLPWLIGVEPEWVRNHLSEIFPPDDDRASLYKATWETFIVWTRPYDNVFEMLKDEYARGITHLHEDSLYRSEGAAARLSEHLVAFYARGLIDLDDESLVQEFYAKASGQQASHVFWFIARILRENDMPPEVLKRLVLLIEQRVANGTGDERTAFGWLFTSGKLDKKRSLELLRDAVTHTRASDPDHSVIERLAELADEFPQLVIESTIQLVDGADTEWKLQYWSPHLRTIISVSVKSGHMGEADLLINKLAAKGLPHFRDLLPRGENP